MALCNCAILLLLLTAYGAWADKRCRIQTISSKNYQYESVPIVGALNITSMAVIQHHSGSPCTQNVSFGIRGLEVFVSRGCVATFEICYEKEPEKRCHIKTLRSNRRKSKRVTIPGIVKVTNVTLLHQFSSAPCVPGVTFGSRGREVFVNKDCKATLKICYEVGSPWNMICDSKGLLLNFCDAGFPVRIISVAKQRSKFQCVKGKTYHTSGTFIVVDQGCSANFIVSL